MQPSDRLHALDAVRGFALLLGVALHGAQPYVAGMPWVTAESPSNLVAGLWYTIHLFRMPLFFLIAGFFGRGVLERRGTLGFIKDRSRRILIPLVAGLPIIMLVTAIAYMLGALAAGADLHSLRGLRPPPSPAPHSLVASINLIHLWFLYYLALFYAGALILRSVFDSMSWSARGLRTALDSVVSFLMRGAWGPLILALPAAAYYAHLKYWSPWGGLPGPMSVIPDVGALIAYGLFFGAGWLLHRQQHLLLSLERRWGTYCVLAVLMWVVCRQVAGTTPHWGPYLGDGALLLYTTCYVAGAWYWTLGLIGAALRWLSQYSPVRRYLADSSYWIYLMHIPALLFVDQIVHPLHWHWSVKYPLSVTGAMVILLLSYHYLVRFTFIGATLNGRRVRRAPIAGSVAAA